MKALWVVWSAWVYYGYRVILAARRQNKFRRPGVSAYAASKSALWGLAKALAAENGSKGITINNINLGYASIGMGINDVPQEYQQIMKKRIPSEKFCEPENILKTVKYLIETDYINGASIDLNGALI